MSRKINPQIEQNSACITSGQVALMALGTGSIIANLSYIQPLLTLVASTFGFSTAGAGIIAMVSQLGTALGMLRFVPLGDKERRSLIVRSLLAACVSLLAMATARSLWWLVVASFGVGPTTATVHIIVPYAANLAPEARRGRVVGTVMSGLLLGFSWLARSVVCSLHALDGVFRTWSLHCSC
ncbi:MAG TPA: MFS transporter [Bryobacteraceae bacterium]|nr:MFS transporter [Bryobacteraceae bacterium]